MVHINKSIHPQVAQESPEIKKTRNKLEKRLKGLTPNATPEKIKQAIGDIKKMLNRQSDDRLSMPLVGRNITFDKNIHSEKTQSPYVRELREKLAEEAAKLPQLYGRITKTNS